MIETPKTLMLKNRPMWKCGCDGIYFNNSFRFCFLVELYHPILGAVWQLCVCVCVCFFGAISVLGLQGYKSGY